MKCLKCDGLVVNPQHVFCCANCAFKFSYYSPEGKAKLEAARLALEARLKALRRERKKANG